jgi:glutamate synthase (NADPH/NADH) small chain
MDYADASGTDQWKPVAVPDSDFEIETDMVIVAVGHEPNALIAKATPQLDLNDNGTIRIDEVSGQTSIPGVFAGGAVVGGAGPVTTAVLAAKQAVKKIDEYLMR